MNIRNQPGSVANNGQDAQSTGSPPQHSVTDVRHGLQVSTTNVQNTEGVRSQAVPAVSSAPSMGCRPQLLATNGPNAQSVQIPPQSAATSASNVRNTLRSVLNSVSPLRAHPYHRGAVTSATATQSMVPRPDLHVQNTSREPPPNNSLGLPTQPDDSETPVVRNQARIITTYLRDARPNRDTLRPRVLLENGTDVTDALNQLTPGTIVKVTRNNGAQLTAIWNGTNLHLRSSHTMQE